MSERDELEQAIAALEAQRATLGDAVVDASLSALREKLAALEAAARSGRQRKQVTILFMDVAGSTAIVRELDPEDNLAIMDTALRRLAEPVNQHDGRVTRFMGDGFMALFGHPVATEHDPDHAVRAGLAILEEARNYAQEIEARWGVAEFDVRVGIDTGLVIIGGESEAENTVAGATVNLAARLESAAQPGTVLISHNTYQHVRGVFDLQPLQPVQAKGFAEPVPVYQALRAKTRSFRTRRRGVEGIETRLIGRESEIKALQDAYHIVQTEGERQMISVVGEAGLGKSRLLYEFENWVDLQPATFTLFRGRARQETERQPYSLFRDLFAFRFGLQDDDPADTVRQKFVDGFQETLAGPPSAASLGDPESVEMKAHFLGHLLGYDFGASPHIQPLGGDPQQLRDRALVYLVEYFKAAAARTPVLILLEDLHWADDSSLDTLNRLVMATREQAVLLASATRPDLFQRRPHWMEGQPFHLRLDLRPLTYRECRLLSQEVLQKVSDIPDALRDLVVANAEGNPFFIEEMVKMLLEEGVVVKEEPAWQVVPEKLAGVRVPSTLTGVLQARLDRLPDKERSTLQQASVVGRVFWEQAVAHLEGQGGDLDPETVAGKLGVLREREMVFRRELSTFTGAQEYIFKHALLRDVTYESVLKSIRRQYHALAAEWLIQQSDERAGGFSGLIANHLELAGRNEQAFAYLRQAGEDASERYAHEEAADFFGRALALVQEKNLESRYELLLAQERAYNFLGKRNIQHKVLEDLESLTARMGNKDHQATVAYRRVTLLTNIGNYEGAVEAAQKTIALAKETNNFEVGSKAYLTRGNVLAQQGHYQEAKTHCDTGLAWARRAGDLSTEGLAFNNLGLIASQLGDFDGARAYFEQAAELAKRAGKPGDESGALNNLGNVASSRREYELAQSYFKRSYKIFQNIGDRRSEAVTLGNVGWVAVVLGRYADAERALQEVLDIQREISYRQSESYTLINLALVSVNSAKPEPARAYAEQALTISRAIGFPTGEAYALTFLAHASLALGDLVGAKAAYHEAVAIHRGLDQEHLAMEPLAGSAQAALESGDELAAVMLVEEILDYLAGGGTLDGTEEPLRVYFICYRVLHAVQDRRAVQILTTAYDLLKEWAAKIEDEATRRSFLENIPWHHMIVTAYKAQDS